MSARIERVEKLAQQVLGEAIDDLKDPRVGFCTVTRVRVSRDLQHARVLVSVLGSFEERERSMQGLRSATPHLRSVLGKEVRLKYLPELIFELDEKADTAQRIEELLRGLQRKGET